MEKNTLNNLNLAIGDLKSLGFSMDSSGTIDHILPSLDGVPETDRLQVARILDAVSTIESMIRLWKSASEDFWGEMDDWTRSTPPKFNIFGRRDKWLADRNQKASSLVSRLDRLALETTTVKSALDSAIDALSCVEGKTYPSSELFVALGVLSVALRSAQNNCSLLNEKYKSAIKQASLYAQLKQTEQSVNFWRAP